MDNWKLVAAIPPLLVWFALFLYLVRIEKKLKAVEQRIKK